MIVPHAPTCTSQDTRSERTETQILSEGQYAGLSAQLDALPATIAHVAVMSTTPVLYSAGTAVQSILSVRCEVARRQG